MYENKDINLIITGNRVNGVEYLDSLRYGKKLFESLQYSVNPFYLFDILTKEGREVFMDYYADDSGIIRKKLGKIG